MGEDITPSVVPTQQEGTAPIGASSTATLTTQPAARTGVEDCDLGMIRAPRLLIFVNVNLSLSWVRRFGILFRLRGRIYSANKTTGT